MGRKEGGKKKGGETAAATPDTYRVGCGAWWGPARPAGSLGEIIIICIGRFVRLRERSAALGRVARVPHPPPRAPGPSRLFHGPAYTLLPGCLGYYRLGPKPVLVKLGHCGPGMNAERSILYIYIYKTDRLDVIIIGLSLSRHSVFQYSDPTLSE